MKITNLLDFIHFGIHPRLKVIHSLVFSGEDALSIVKPAVLGLILCDAAVVFFVRRRNNTDNTD